MDDKTALAILRVQLQAGRRVRASVRGVSMEPLFHEGDKVVIAPSGDYQPGDVAAFHYGHEGLLVHRIVKIAGGYVHLKGDNAVRIEIVPVSALLGVVEADGAG